MEQIHRNISKTLAVASSDLVLMSRDKKRAYRHQTNTLPLFSPPSTIVAEAEIQMPSPQFDGVQKYYDLLKNISCSNQMKLQLKLLKKNSSVLAVIIVDTLNNRSEA